MRQVTFWREKISDPFILLRIPRNFLRYTQSNSVTFPVDPLDKVNRNNAHQVGKLSIRTRFTLKAPLCQNIRLCFVIIIKPPLIS